MGEGAGAIEFMGGMAIGDGGTTMGVSAPPALKVKAIDTSVWPTPPPAPPFGKKACTMFLHTSKKRLVKRPHEDRYEKLDTKTHAYYFQHS